MNFCKTAMNRTLAACAIVATCWAAPSQAQTSTQPDELQAIYACKTISSPDERLACYDQTVGRFEQAEKSGDVVTVSKKAIEKVERDAFGFNIPSLPSLGRIFGGGSSSDKPKRNKNENALTAPVKDVTRSKTPIEPRESPVLPSKPTPSTITEVTLDIRKTTEFGYKKTRFFMANGQVWEQTDSTNVRVPKSRGGAVPTARISKASLGSFFLRVNGKGAAIRVKRVR